MVRDHVVFIENFCCPTSVVLAAFSASATALVFALLSECASHLDWAYARFTDSDRGVSKSAMLRRRTAD